MAAQFACGVVWVSIWDDHGDGVVWASAKYSSVMPAEYYIYLSSAPTSLAVVTDDSHEKACPDQLSDGSAAEVSVEGSRIYESWPRRFVVPEHFVHPIKRSRQNYSHWLPSEVAFGISHMRLWSISVCLCCVTECPPPDWRCSRITWEKERHPTWSLSSRVLCLQRRGLAENERRLR